VSREGSPCGIPSAVLKKFPLKSNKFLLKKINYVLNYTHVGIVNGKRSFQQRLKRSSFDYRLTDQNKTFMPSRNARDFCF
jgi:hypothetical protein